MTQTYTWDDIGELADALSDAYPETDPLTISFPRLHRMISELEEFGDDPAQATERRLEEIQMAWYDLWED
jgi:FeS assembly protein IscX